MLYCTKCDTIYDLPVRSLTREIDPWWARNRYECPNVLCRGYVYDIDEEMIPIIKMIKEFLDENESHVNIAPLWSCAGHWYKESKECPSVPYLTMAILPDSIDKLTPKEIAHYEANNQLRKFISEVKNPYKWKNLLIKIDDDAECIHPLFADFNGGLHRPEEGWIALTVRLDYNKMIERFHLAYDNDMPYRKYLNYVNDPVNKLVRHCEYITIFTSELIELLHHLKNFQITGGTNDDKC